MPLFEAFADYNNPNSFVNKLRKKRFSYIQKTLESLIEEKGRIKVLDIGGEIGYWKSMGWVNNKCTIYLLNLPSVPTSETLEGFVNITGNALELPFTFGEFDLVFSNSVIEHVGSYRNQQIFAEEVIRIVDRYIIQTPSFWFPLEPHSLIPFFQFIPHFLRAYLIMWGNINYFPKAVNYADALTVSKSTLMLTKKEFQSLFRNASIQVEYLFGIPKSYSAIKL